MKDRRREDVGRSGYVPGYAILALLCLLVVDLSGGLLPLPEWAILALAVVLSALVVVGLLRGGHYFPVLLFCVVFLNIVTDLRSLPSWVDVVANVAWVAIMPFAVLIAVREWRTLRREKSD